MAFIVAASAIIGALYLNPFKSTASYDKDKAITYGEFNQRTPVADRYFFVGTYLFSLDVITDDIYEKAINSQSEMSQFNEYYKSELAGGVWFDISDATDLTNITVNGTKVDEQEQNKLYVTVYIDEQGQAFDAKTMAPISLFDIPDPYSLKDIPELNTLYSQYKASFSEDSKGVNLFYYEQLKSFFDTDLRSKDGQLRAETEKLDRKLQNLQTAYSSLQGSDKTEQAEAVQKLMKRVDNARRALIYKKLAIGDEKDETVKYELNKLSMVLSNQSEYGVSDIDNDDEIEQSTMPYDAWTNDKKQYTYDQLYNYVVNHDGLVTVGEDEDEDDDDEDEDKPKVLPDFKSFFKDTRFEGASASKQVFVQNDAILSLINDADSDCKKAYDKYTSESLATPDSHIGKATFDREEAIFAQAEGGYSGDMDQKLEELVTINNIAANVVKDKDKELDLVKSELLSACETGFAGMVSGGAGEEYTAAVSQGANDDGVNSALEAQGAKLNKEMTELEFMITAYRMRVTPKECFHETLAWIDWTDSLGAEVAGDIFASKAKIAISTHKAWLTDLLSQLVKEDESLQSELDKLKAQKEALNEEKMKALDENDLNGAKKIDAKLEEIDKRIAEEVERAAKIVNNQSASASTKAASAVGLAGTTEGAIQDIKKDALDKLSNGEDASEEMQALEELGAKNALAEIEDAKKGSGSDSSKNEGGNGSGNVGESSEGTSGSAASDGSEKNDNDEQGQDGNKDGNVSQDGNEGGTGNGAGSSQNVFNKKKSISTLSENELLAILEDVLGGSFESLNPSGKVVAAVALEWAGDAGNATAKKMARNFIDICASEKNIYVYDTCMDGAKVLVNLATIGKVTDYRYVYKSAGKEGTLAKGKESYSFVFGSRSMKIAKGNSSETMAAAATLKYGSLYVPSDTVKEHFVLTAVSIKNAQYSAVLNSKMEVQANELLDVFKNGGLE